MAFAHSLQNKKEVPALLSQLVQDEKLLKASHPSMYAYRVSSADKGLSDCGESGAGQCILSVLDKNEINGVLVVVTRWYGGIPLGGARFREIRKVSIEALKEGKYIK